MAINKGPGNMQLDLFTDTRRASYEAIKPKANTIKNDCLFAFKRIGSMTADEIASALNKSILTIRPRVAELAKEGLIEDTGIRRENDSGKLATVWKAK